MRKPPSPDPGWKDRRLIRSCLAGNEAAWHALVDKYKNLVYSIILKYGINAEESNDVFQGVWLDAYNDLPNLRRRDAFKAWLVSLTTHKCFHWQRRHRRREQVVTSSAPEDLGDHEIEEPAFVEELERDQLVREAILGLTPRCREMIKLLFFTFPPKPYQEVAEQLGLATGSIGFIRRRCLQRLQKALESHGLH